MNENRNLLMQAKQFATANANKISTIIAKFKSTKTAQYIAGLGNALTKKGWWKAGASVIVLSAGVGYTTTIGVSAWLAEKILNLPVNILRIATGLLTLPFSVAETLVNKARKVNDKPTVTTKPYYLVVRAMKAWKKATNYVAALYVRTAMNPIFRTGLRAAVGLITVSAIYGLMTGAITGITAAFVTIATGIIPVFLFTVVLGMIFVALNDLLNMNEKVANVANTIFKFLFVTPFVLIGKALTFVFKAITGRKITKSLKKSSAAYIADLKQQRDCALAERDFAIQRAEEAEEAALIFKGEAEKLSKKTNGYTKKEKRREPRSSGNPAKHAV